MRTHPPVLLLTIASGRLASRPADRNASTPGCRGGALDDLGLGGLKRGLDLAGQLGGHFRWLLYGHLIDQILWDAAKNLGAAKAIEAGNDEPPASKSGL